MLKNKRGFTLIELLVVISIISLLSSVVIANLANARMKARNAERATELSSLRTALELHNLQFGRYPISCGWNGLYTNSGWGGDRANCNYVVASRTYSPAQPDNYTDWIQGLVVNGFINGLPTDPAAILNNTTSGRNYLYLSPNGRDYKLIAHGIGGDGCLAYFRNSSMRDPARDGGTSSTTIDGTGCGAAGYWTSGAVGW